MAIDRWRVSRRVRGVVAVALVGMVAGCGDDPFQLQVIEEIEFAASLGIDLSMMQTTANGVYVQDMPVGAGAELVLGGSGRIGYTGWLANGTVFDQNADWAMLMDGVIPGFAEGLNGMLVGGTRLMVIPPALAYGGAGASGVPPGSILVFEVELLSVD